MSKKTVHRGSYDIEFTAEQAQFLKNLTGRDNFQDAVEHYVMTCLEFSLDPAEELAKINPEINPHFADGYLGEDDERTT